MILGGQKHHKGPGVVMMLGRKGGICTSGLTGHADDLRSAPADPWPARASDFIIGGVQQLKAFILNRKASLLFLQLFSCWHLSSREQSPGAPIWLQAKGLLGIFPCPKWAQGQIWMGEVGILRRKEGK